MISKTKNIVVLIAAMFIIGCSTVSKDVEPIVVEKEYLIPDTCFLVPDRVILKDIEDKDWFVIVDNDVMYYVFNTEGYRVIAGNIDNYFIYANQAKTILKTCQKDLKDFKKMY